ncbi:MAG: hypothetical protein ACJ789_05875 [Thermomicrobiales bacterium]
MRNADVFATGGKRVSCEAPVVTVIGLNDATRRSNTIVIGSLITAALCQSPHQITERASRRAPLSDGC